MSICSRVCFDVGALAQPHGNWRAANQHRLTHARTQTDLQRLQLGVLALYPSCDEGNGRGIIAPHVECCDVMMEKPNRKDIAVFFVTGLRIGSIAPAEAIRWADSAILNDGMLDNEVIDVAMSGSGGVERTINALNRISGEIRPGMPERLMAAYCGKKLRSGEWTGEYGAHVLSRLLQIASLVEAEEALEEIRVTLIDLGDRIEWARFGAAGAVEEALNHLRKDLESFEQYEQMLPNTL